MAGNQYSLKRITKEKFASKQLNIFAFTIVNNIGSWLAIMSTVLIIRYFILKYHIADTLEVNLFTVCITYSFVFGQLITSFFQTVFSRHLSDNLYNKDATNIQPNMIGIIKTNIIIALLLWLIFLTFSKLTPVTNVLILLLFLQVVYFLTVQPIMASIGITKYGVLFLIVGMIIATITMFVSLYMNLNFKLDYEVAIMLLSFILGISLCNILQTISIFKRTKYGKTEAEYSWLESFDKYKDLRYVSLLYTLGMWIPNILYWFSQDSTTLLGSFRVNIVYDTSVFIGYLIIIPTYLSFFMAINSKVFPVFRKFLTFVNKGGTLEMIEHTKNYLNKLLLNELERTFRLQSVISIIALTIIWIYSSQNIFFSLNSSILQLVIIGTTLNGFILILIMMNMYLDNQKGALKISKIFCITNILASIITYLLFKEGAYGLNLIISGVISFSYGMIILYKYIEKIDCKLFTFEQTSVKNGRMSMLYHKISHNIINNQTNKN
ncbi:exopolysaccharide Pel transporter PelG [Mycoplasma sp. P36-A1]|uniref:exopolysaccharide Pel transporter PelG n=1 Tax=Mycoplasma sp. P36-A1 TaxID=3252900 RepID=UPI003C2EE7EE